MTVNPGIIALLLSSTLTALMLGWAALFGINILGRWDIRSGSEEQLRMERKTYLVSTFLANALLFELLALFLFIQSAERMHTLFVGAMCAAGTLYVNPFGYPALYMRILLAALAGLWLIINMLDSRAPDYPLIKIKYSMLLVLAPIAIASMVLNWLYLTGLKADVITSCCGTLFSVAGETVRGEVGILGGNAMFYAYIACSAAMLLLGGLYYKTSRGALTFGLLSALILPFSLMAIITWVSPYVYELPTHHCPFCMLQGDYHFIGYPVYALLLASSVLGMGGAAASSARLKSIPGVQEKIRKRLTLFSMVAFALFAAIIVWLMASSNLVME